MRENIVQNHDMLLYRPFIEGGVVVPITFEHYSQVIKAYNELRYQLLVKPDWYWSCRSRSAFMNIMIVLKKHYQMLRTGELTVCKIHPAVSNNNYVKKALLYIESHYMVKITLQDILKECSTNHTTLTVNFKKETGVTVMNYLKRYRVDMAKKKLQFTEIPLKEIARSCGFTTPEHFSRIFSEIVGVPPAQFRRQAVARRIMELQSR